MFAEIPADTHEVIDIAGPAFSLHQGTGLLRRDFIDGLQAGPSFEGPFRRGRVGRDGSQDPAEDIILLDRCDGELMELEKRGFRE
jgi:hypothetical protein